ncbi:N-acetylmuramoyl-L-alanine amidase [Marixanthomonas sp. SCSIO 43207]|uniref:N-acetylmuramoyl-L-alanine amidase family protein n=1 Tax=Marixanthomonas sp. SCSIO 43207 TaxID=2779360 RepID=UPI001CA82DDB|nr:N-acetylmuramoyl-L-alanine amidase [Marixanthomonas sp. SCSIO 43207]UAB80652.1 N-acetylmuramoyl-L-alanine amidase [Marixanthomonas sp. SCSIO 43207]
MKTKHIPFLVLLIAIAISFSFSKNETTPVKPFVVVLDAGHGGHDSGNVGNGYKEKDIALKIVLEVGSILEKQPNIKVIYTRKTDKFVDLYKRGAIANEADADLFVSVHCNAHNSQAFGTETFVLGLHANQRNLEVAKKENEVIFLEDNYQENYAGYDPNAPESFIGLTLMQEEYLDQSIMLAGLIQNNFTNKLKRKDRSVKQAGFIVLHQSYMPSVLVETGFLTNDKEGAYLNSTRGQKEIANAIAEGVLSYHKNLGLATSKAKNPEITQEEIDKAIDSTEEKIYSDYTFKVQLAASSKKLSTKPENFKGLKEITRSKENGLYKYYYGETSDYNKIELMKTFAKEKGYASCYIVAFKDGKKHKLSEVLKTQQK